ncbi:MAG: recombinase family protein [Candidatus Peregrinibacteria bacterium]|nr:recombinase family protein [Candidatus Peregrinibacteria bacterium]MCB9808321.1 recombinase family protein [Candidatus Peribacteria bacterium]
MPVPAVAYCRCSMDKEGSYGLDVQRSLISKFAEQNDYAVLRCFAEEGVSGADANRALWSDLIVFVEANPDIQHVIILRMDRLARDLILQETMLMELRKRNVQLVSVDEPDLCSKDPTRTMYRQIRGAISEFERSLIARRLQQGRVKKAETGKYSGGGAPYGYRLVNGELRVQENEAEIVRCIFRSRRKPKQGKRLSYAKIANMLNEQDIEAPKGRLWLPCTVHYIHNSNVYRGVYSYGGVEKRNEALKIV